MKKTFLIILTFLMCITNIKALTREELEDMVVSTALSYLNNNIYTDYDQFSMDKTTKMTYENSSGQTKTATNTSISWRKPTISPEDINRTNIFSIDCSSFTGMVYKYALGYDFSEYYGLYSDQLFYSFNPEKNIFNRYTVQSASDFNSRLYLFGRGNAGRNYIAAAAYELGIKPTSGTSYKYQRIVENVTAGKNYTFKDEQIGVYLYRVKDYKKETPLTSDKLMTQELKTAYDNMVKVLRPGDMINILEISNVTNADGTTTPTTTGHSMLYIGDILGVPGVVHSAGSDFYKRNGTLNELATSDDNHSVRFDSLEEYVYKNRFRGGKITYINVVRPINKMPRNTNGSFKDIDTNKSITIKLDGRTIDTEKITINSKARTAFKWLKTEQYIRTKKAAINMGDLTKSATEYNTASSQYNSVSVGDNIEYVLYLQNLSNKGYCIGTNGGKFSNKTDCLKSTSRKWVTLGKQPLNQNLAINNLTITATIPANTTYVKGSCTDNCKEINATTIQWTGISLANAAGNELSYKVKVNSGTTITNPGIKIKNGNYTLQMGKLTTKVNPTLNRVNADLFREKLVEFKKAISGTTPKIKYGSTSTSYEVPSDGTTPSTFTSYGFVKNIYYNATGIKLGDLSRVNIINAIFNKDKTYDSYAKKTETEIKNLKNTAYININKMLVKGFYGGRYLKGNDNGDRPGRLRLTDLEFGDLIATFSTSGEKVTASTVIYMYVGNNYLTTISSTETNSNDGKISVQNDKKGNFITFASGNKILVYPSDSSKYKTNGQISIQSKTGYELFNEFWTKDLFVVLRPSQLYGTTVKYSGGTILGKSSSVEYNTYKGLKDLTSTKEYTVTFNYGSQECKDCLKTYTGKNTFGGWYLDAPNYTKSVKNTDALSSKTTHTVYAKWNNYVTLPKETITGYSLNNWYTTSSLSGDSLKAGSQYKLTKNQTLYAKWTAHKYTVKYNSNGGTGTMSNQSHTYDSTEELTLNKFTKSGYVFDGWSKTASGNVAYEDGASVKNLTSTDNGTVTLYAKWRVKEPDEFEVSLTLKNATSDATKKTIKKGSTATFTITPKTGYTNCKTNVDTLKITDNKLTITNVTKNTSVTVTCSGIKYSVIYNPNGGEGTMENSSHTYGTAKELNPNKYYKNGYSFRGWSKTINGTIEFKDEENVVNLTTSSKYNLFAVWSPKTYKITYELNGGTLNNKITTYKITSEDIKLDIPKKEGYTFKGWTTDDNKTPQKEVIIPKGSTGNKTYTANYETGKYKIIYKSDKYGTITGITEETLNYKSSPSGTTKTIKEGYKNLKWSVNKDVTLKNNTIVLEGSPITESQIKEIVVREDLVITAYHYAKKYKVSYSNSEQGKIKGITNEDVSHNSNPLGTKTTPNKGYKFKYWVANKDVKLKDGKTIQKGKQIKDIKSIVVSENITFTPVFEKGTFKISYQSDNNGIITGSEIQNVTYPDTLSLTQTTSLDENYEFQHWTSNTDVLLNDDTEIKKGDPITNDELTKIVATNDMVLTANYSQQLFNVYYLNYEDIVVTENSKEIVGKKEPLTGPKLDRSRWDKEIVYTSDKNVTLSSGKTIKAGKAITQEQLKQINVNQDLNITPRYESDLKLINFDKLNMDLILTIIFIVIAIPVGIYIIKSMKKNKIN